MHGRSGNLYPTRDTLEGLARFQATVDQFGQHSPTGGVLMSANITRRDALSTPNGHCEPFDHSETDSRGAIISTHVRPPGRSDLTQIA